MTVVVATCLLLLLPLPAAGQNAAPSSPAPRLHSDVAVRCALVRNAVKRSEELLYAADLDAALGMLRPERFAATAVLPESCRVALAAQTAEIVLLLPGRHLQSARPDRRGW